MTWYQSDAGIVAAYRLARVAASAPRIIRACRISVYTNGSIDDPPDALATHRMWMKERLIQMKKVFGPRIG
jgi:hypothetical protein